MTDAQSTKGKWVALISPNASDLAPPSISSVITKRFPDGESYCRLEGAENIAGKDVIIVHRLFPHPDENLVTLLQIMYGAKNFGAKKIRLVIPYLPYARSDKEWLAGEVVSSRLLARLLRQNGAKEVYTWDCHFLKKPGRAEYEGLRIINGCMGEKLVAYLKKLKPNAVLVSPDAGAKYLVGESGLFMRKERGGYAEQEKAHRPIAKMEADFDVSGKDIILIDDMIAGGGTMIRAGQKCLSMGAKSVSCAATHGMFLDGALERMTAAGINTVATSDSVPNPSARVSMKEEIAKILK